MLSSSLSARLTVLGTRVSVCRVIDSVASSSCVINSSTPGIRQVHSKRQRKRLFDNNPARARVEARARLGQPPKESTPPPVREYPPIFEPHLLSNGWSAPPPSTLDVPKYPFTITRTKNKPLGAAGFLPVYSYYRKDGTKITTRIRKVSGDSDVFMQELRAVLAEYQQDEPSIRVRTGGTIEIDGNHVRPVKMWLAGLGF